MVINYALLVDELNEYWRRDVKDGVAATPIQTVTSRKEAIDVA